MVVLGALLSFLNSQMRERGRAPFCGVRGYWQAFIYWNWDSTKPANLV